MCTTKAVTPYLDLNITARACHSPNHNTRHKRAADECVNPGSIQRSPENDWKLPSFNRQDQDYRCFCKNFNLRYFSFLIKAIECLVNRLIRYQILGFILSIIYKFGCINGGQSKEKFSETWCAETCWRVARGGTSHTPSWVETSRRGTGLADHAEAVFLEEVDCRGLFLEAKIPKQKCVQQYTITR